ncbi:hypothetical protein GGF46_002848 [Coemansia sp. RSA 552]|nr:hypothetical protein GGF46_002848 [Coemansia sp. RSA 552]
MGNGMFSEMEEYCGTQTDQERLYLESRAKLAYCKQACRRLRHLLSRLTHFRTNPLGGPMCKDLEKQIFQQRLLVQRVQAELDDMVAQYNQSCQGSESDVADSGSTQADWEEVMEMARQPIDSIREQQRSIGSCMQSGSLSGTSTATESVDVDAGKAFPWKITPPLEDMAAMRKRLRILEQSPLFTDMPAALARRMPFS